MNFNDYQRLAARTINPGLNDFEQLANAALGLAGEAGEAADALKKHLFHGHPLDADAVAKEIGDVLWYAAAVCTSIGVDLDDVAARNVAKLRARYPEGFSEDASRNRVQEEPGAEQGEANVRDVDPLHVDSVGVPDPQHT